MVGRLGSEGLRSRILTPPPTFSKLPTSTPFHTICVKSSSRQVVFASSRSRQVCLRRIVNVPIVPSVEAIICGFAV